ELTATIDACNKSNVAVYAVDARGLLATAPGGSSWNRTTPGKTRSLAVSSHNPAHQSSLAPPRLVLAAYPVMAMPAPQHGGGGGTRGGSGGGGMPNSHLYNSNYSQPRSIIPQLPPSAATNQQVLAALADGTGGFYIFNTNDLLSGLEKIGREQNEFYILGYAPPDTPEGSCHTLKVKMNQGGLHVRSRSGYCNVRMANVL